MIDLGCSNHNPLLYPVWPPTVKTNDGAWMAICDHRTKKNLMGGGKILDLGVAGTELIFSHPHPWPARQCSHLLCSAAKWRHIHHSDWRKWAQGKPWCGKQEEEHSERAVSYSNYEDIGKEMSNMPGSQGREPLEICCSHSPKIGWASSQINRWKLVGIQASSCRFRPVGRITHCPSSWIL